MLHIFFKTSQNGCTPKVLLKSLCKYHRSVVAYKRNSSFSTFTENETLKIVNAINTMSLVELEKCKMEKTDIKKLLAYRDTNGKFESFDDILKLQDITSLSKFYESVLYDEKPKEKNTKRGKRKSLITPDFDKDTANKITKILGLFVLSNKIYWAMIDKNRNLLHWDFIILKNSSKTSLVSSIDLLIKIICELPRADAYVIESDHYVSSESLKKSLVTNYVQRQQVLVTMLTALKMLHQPKNNDIPEINNIYMLQCHAAARQFNLFVGSETISTQSTVTKILQDAGQNSNSMLSNIEPHIMDQYKSYHISEREQLHKILLVTLTFINLLNDKKST